MRVGVRGRGEGEGGGGGGRGFSRQRITSSRPFRAAQCIAVRPSFCCRAWREDAPRSGESSGTFTRARPFAAARPGRRAQLQEQLARRDMAAARRPHQRRRAMAVGRRRRRRRAPARRQRTERLRCGDNRCNRSGLGLLWRQPLQPQWRPRLEDGPVRVLSESVIGGQSASVCPTPPGTDDGAHAHSRATHTRTALHTPADLYCSPPPLLPQSASTSPSRAAARGAGSELRAASAAAARA